MEMVKRIFWDNLLSTQNPKELATFSVLPNVSNRSYKVELDKGNLHNMFQVSIRITLQGFGTTFFLGNEGIYFDFAESMIKSFLKTV